MRARANLDRVLIRQDKIDEAIKPLEELLEDNPQRQELWSLLANANLALEKLDTTRNLYISLQPGEKGVRSPPERGKR